MRTYPSVLQARGNGRVAVTMTERKQIHVSPDQFAVLQLTILREESLGESPEVAVLKACSAAGIDPPQPFEPVDIIVDGEQGKTDV